MHRYIQAYSHIHTHIQYICIYTQLHEYIRMQYNISTLMIYTCLISISAFFKLLWKQANNFIHCFNVSSCWGCMAWVCGICIWNKWSFKISLKAWNTMLLAFLYATYIHSTPDIHNICSYAHNFTCLAIFYQTNSTYWAPY